MYPYYIRGLSSSETRNIRDSFIFPERRQYESLVYMKVKKEGGTCPLRDCTKKSDGRFFSINN
ncbi:MAG: hypothetical protein DRI57_25295 [Deltaproteobacteria bacterium]|nr:MAG: hypothetical protein DRI57_25295 [Deltaproteobacteria bacterium]